MWNRPANWKLILGVILAAPTVSALAADGDMISQTNKNRLTLKGRATFNISAKFTKLAAFKPARSVGGTGGALDHYYDDGFVRVDNSGNFGGQTWFWGYDTAAQVSGDNILFHSSSSDGASSKDVDDAPYPGFELVYNRELGKFGKKEQHRWGLEASIGWTSIGLSDKSTLRGNLTRITDSYSFTPGTTPPAAPFQGTFEGPNFVINDTPTRSSASVPGGATVNGKREFDGDLFIGHLGPYAEFQLSEKLFLGVSGGLAVGLMNGDLALNQTASFAGAPSISRRASSNDSDVLLGGFIGANLSYQFNERWSAGVGVQFESLGDYTQSAGGSKAKVDLGAAFHVSVGVSYSF
jgi:hypothetical protein